MNHSALAASAAGVALLAGATVFLMAPPSHPEDRLALVVDTTPTNVPAARCTDGRDAIAVVLGAGGRDLVVDARFTGSGRSGHEARTIDPLVHRRLPGLVHGRRAAPTLPADFLAVCEAVPPTAESPIFRAVSAALRDLRLQATPDRRLFLVIRTDGLEEEDARLVRRLRGAPSVGGAPEARLDNDGVAVRFCGVGRRAGSTWLGQPAPGLDVVEAAWRAEFNHPDTVSFTSTCT